ncbi:MAG: GGDEF domain-containing protein [Elusimicrobiota bacterium]
MQSSERCEAILLIYLSFSILLVFAAGYVFLQRNIRYSKVILIGIIVLLCFGLAGFRPSWEYFVLGIIVLTAAGFVLTDYQKNIAAQEKELTAQACPIEEQLTAARAENIFLKEKNIAAEKEITQISHLYEITKNITRALNWEEIVVILAEALEEHFQTQSWAFYFYEQENNRFSLVRQINIDGKKSGFIEAYLRGRGIFDQEKPFLLEKENLLLLPLWREGANTKGRVVKSLLGTIFMEFAEPEKPASLLDRGESFSSQIVLGLEKAWLYKEIEQMSRIDGLTGIYRRGYFLQRLDEEMSKARYWRTSLSLIMLDIDHFKRYNDNYGHQAGDDILRRVAQLIKGSIYETDLLGRYGGEEFVLLLLRAESSGVLRKTDDLRRRIESEVIALGLEKLRVTVSLGIAHFPIDAVTAAELIAKADQALYWAKDHGRNQVIEFNKTH